MPICKIKQPGHGLVIGDVVRMVSGNWVRCGANDKPEALVTSLANHPTDWVEVFTPRTTISADLTAAPWPSGSAAGDVLYWDIPAGAYRINDPGGGRGIPYARVMMAGAQGVIEMLSGEATRTLLASATTSGDANEPDEIHTLAAGRVDRGWEIDSNEFRFTEGAPDHVIVSVNEFTDPVNARNLIRVAPILEVLRNGDVIGTIQCSYQRHGTGHNSSSNGNSLFDPTPGVEPVYSLRSQQGSNRSAALPITEGIATVVAHLMPI